MGLSDHFTHFYLCGPGVVCVKCWDRLCILGRAPRTKETLPDFHEWCRVIRHSLIFRGLTGGQRDTPIFGASHHVCTLSFKIRGYFYKKTMTFLLKTKQKLMKHRIFKFRFLKVLLIKSV